MTLVTLAQPGSYSSSLASRSAAESMVPGGGRRSRCDWLFVRPIATACLAWSAADVAVAAVCPFVLEGVASAMVAFGVEEIELEVL